MARNLRTPEAMRRAIELVPSPCNGITMCQGTFATMGADIPAEIRDFAHRGALHFVHFRDVRGTPERFVETFHDDGQTDMFAAMRTYQEVGFGGPLRPDHVPTMEGEENLAPGYDVLGRLFAIGYIKGLAEGAAKSGVDGETARRQDGKDENTLIADSCSPIASGTAAEADPRLTGRSF
jgi:mannonate dehydratase